MACFPGEQNPVSAQTKVAKIFSNRSARPRYLPFSPLHMELISFISSQAVSEMPWIIGHRIAVKLLAAVCLPAVGYLGSYLHIYSMDGQQRLLCFTPKTAAGIHTASHRHRWRGNPSADNPPLDGTEEAVAQTRPGRPKRGTPPLGGFIKSSQCTITLVRGRMQRVARKQALSGFIGVCSDGNDNTSR